MLCQSSSPHQHFSDAGEVGFGAVMYLRMQKSQNDIHVAFLMDKARVTPLKSCHHPPPRADCHSPCCSHGSDAKGRASDSIAGLNFWMDST